MVDSLWATADATQDFEQFQLQNVVSANVVKG